MQESSAEGCAFLSCGNETEFKERYKVGKFIGAGYSGEVFEAIRLSDNVEVAVKFLNVEGVRKWDDKDGRRLPMEVSVLAKVKGIPGVVQIYDYFRGKDMIFIVMEKPPNFLTMEDFIWKEKSIDEDRARIIFIQVVETLLKCVQKGVMYSDLETDNVLLDLDSFKSVVIDFGEAIFVSDQHSETNGTTQESCSGELPIVRDVAKFLFQMISGDTDYELILTEDLVLSNPDFSMECKDFLCYAMSADVENGINLQMLLDHSWVKKAGENMTKT